MKQYCVYVVTNKYNTVFYVGSSSNLPVRKHQHKNKLIEGFTKRYNLYKLVYYEIYSDPENMVNRERAMKNLKREKKLDLIRKMNPGFEELEV